MHLFIIILCIVFSAFLGYLLGNVRYEKDNKYQILEEEENIVINFNQATYEELFKVHGIGDILAKRILSERTRRGVFDSWCQVNKVYGIGDSKIKQLKEVFYID